jgi:hypothetical protein
MLCRTPSLPEPTLALHARQRREGDCARRTDACALPAPYATLLVDRECDGFSRRICPQYGRVVIAGFRDHSDASFGTDGEAGPAEGAVLSRDLGLQAAIEAPQGLGNRRLFIKVGLGHR